MKIAILTDCTGVGGGMTFIRRFIAAHPGDETRLFLSDDGECTAAKVDAWGADLVHVNHLKSLLQLLGNPFRRPKGRVVFVVHGVHLRKYDFLPKTPRNVLARRLRLALERWLYARCDGLVALNADDVEYLRRVHGVKVPVRLEPNTVDPVDAVSGPAPEYAFATVARFDFQKGYDVLLDAVAIAADRLRRAHARGLLVGGGGLLDEMKRRAESLGVSDILDFAGELPDAADEMRRGAVLVAPSRWEGSPYTVLEALARGIWVVASDCPGNRDLVRDGVNGRLFPVCDAPALAELLVDPRGAAKRAH